MGEDLLEGPEHSDRTDVQGKRAHGRGRKDKDPVLAALRGNLKEFSPRLRQGVIYARSMYVEELRQFAEELRRRTERGEPLATMACIGVLVGLTPNVVPKVVLARGEKSEPPSAFYIDTQGGRALYDLDRVLEVADRFNGEHEDRWIPATRWVRITLPPYVAEQLARRHARSPGATRVRELLGQSVWEGRARFAMDPGYRLKWTLARLRRSLGPHLVESGVSALVASAALVDFRLVTKSNFSYVSFAPTLVDDALHLLHDDLGWS